MHAHAADANHQHSHADAPGEPGRPGGINMPDVALNSQPPGDMYEAAGIDILEVTGRYLESQGVDVARELRHLDYAREDQDRATGYRVVRLRQLAGRLAKAERDLDAELAALRNSWAGASHAAVTAAHDERERLRAELLEACGNDVDLAARVRHGVH